MQDIKLRRKLFGRNNEECMNLNTKNVTIVEEDSFGCYEEFEIGTGFMGQTLKEMRLLRAEIVSLKARVTKLEKKRK